METNLHIDDIASALTELSGTIFKASTNMDDLISAMSIIQKLNDDGFDDSELENISFLYPDWEVSSC